MRPCELILCIWIVDDDCSVRFVLAAALRDAGYRVEEFETANETLHALTQNARPDLLITDVRMPGDNGLHLLKKLKQHHPDLPVVVMSAYTDVTSTGSAFRGGAQEFLSKPFDLDDAIQIVQRLLQHSQDQPQVVSHPSNVVVQPALIGQTKEMRSLFRAIGRLAQAPLSVLITGETGTGKELVARALHNESPRAHQPFVALNTAAIPPELLESELFGHEVGAFTGATRRHIGRFEQARDGTLFLDEVGDMPIPLQKRLLRVLAENEFFRVGGCSLIRVDVRVIAATHQDLDALVEQKIFRADLLHRLDVVRLHLPPLRERRSDILELATCFLNNASKKLNSRGKQLSSEALNVLHEYHWPGNVRELENICWRLAALTGTDCIHPDDVIMALSRGKSDAISPLALHGRWDILLSHWADAQLKKGEPTIYAQARSMMDKTLLEAALKATGGRRTEAAMRLGLGRNTLTRKLGSGRRRH